MRLILISLSHAQVSTRTSGMLDDFEDIIERLNAKSLTDTDIQLLRHLLQRNTSASVSQSGKFNLAIEEGNNLQVGDHYTGATPEQIRLIVHELLQELRSLQLPHSESSPREENEDDPPFRQLFLDPTIVKTINGRLEIIKEISEAGYLPETCQNELRQLKQRLHDFRTLNEDLQQIAQQGDRLIHSAILSMQLAIDSLKLAGRKIIEIGQIQASPTELDCQQREAQIFHTFVDRLEDSRLGAAWIGRNMEVLVKYATRTVVERFPDLNASDQAIDDFEFSLKQFLEQVNFCLYWGNHDILDSPGIPLVFGIQQYEVAFQAVKKLILKKQLRTETIQEMRTCLDYLIECLQLY